MSDCSMLNITFSWADIISSRMTKTPSLSEEPVNECGSAEHSLDAASLRLFLLSVLRRSKSWNLCVIPSSCPRLHRRRRPRPRSRRIRGRRRPSGGAPEVRVALLDNRHKKAALLSTTCRNSRRSAMASAVGKTLPWALLPMCVLRAICPPRPDILGAAGAV